MLWTFLEQRQIPRETAVSATPCRALWQQNSADRGAHLLTKLSPTACLEVRMLFGVKASSSNCIHHLICSLGVLVHNADLQQRWQASPCCGHSRS